MSEIKRKIVQIATATEGNSHEMDATLYALCDDGSLWVRAMGRWSEVDGIPDAVEASPPSGAAAAQRAMIDDDIDDIPF
jgi:hypothetical protein